MKYRDLRENIPAFSIKENDSRPDKKNILLKEGKKERKTFSHFKLTVIIIKRRMIVRLHLLCLIFFNCVL